MDTLKASDMGACIGSAIGFLAASAWVPFLGPLISLLTPLPFLFYATKLGLYQGVKIAVIAVLIAGLIAKVAGAPQFVFACIIYSSLGLFLSEAFRREYSVGLTVFFGTGTALVLGALFLFAAGLVAQKGPIEILLGYFQGNLEQAIDVYQKSSSDEQTVLMLQEYVRVIMAALGKVYPALAAVYVSVVVWLNILVSRPLFRLGKQPYPSSLPMDQWFSPDRMVWGLIGAGFSLFLPLDIIKLVAVNILIVMLVIYTFHGLAIFLFFMNKYRVPSWARVGVFILVFFQQIFLLIAALAGLFDQWVDFRKLRARKQPG